MREHTRPQDTTSVPTHMSKQFASCPKATKLIRPPGGVDVAPCRLCDPRVAVMLHSLTTQLSTADSESMDENDTINMLINPYYAINFDPGLAAEHEPLVVEEQWIQANLRLMDEIGAQEWLERLLAALQGAGPLNP